MDVRPASQSDLGAIAELHVRCWQEAYAGQLPQAYLDSLTADQRTPLWSTILANTSWPFTGAFVLTDEDGLVGLANVCPSRDADATGRTGEITSIYVRRHVWGRGGGRTLITAALSTLTVAGFDDAVLWVLEGNVRARQFYEAGGWQYDDVERLETVGGAQVREVRYRRSLL